MRFTITGLVLACSFIAIGASAQGLHAVKPLGGWTCMKLNLSQKQSLDPSVHVVVRAGPRADAPELGWAAMTVAVRSPVHKVNGFEELLFPNGKRIRDAQRYFREPGLRADHCRDENPFGIFRPHPPITRGRLDSG